MTKHLPWLILLAASLEVLGQTNPDPRPVTGTGGSGAAPTSAANAPGAAAPAIDPLQSAGAAGATNKSVPARPAQNIRRAAPLATNQSRRGLAARPTNQIYRPMAGATNRFPPRMLGRATNFNSFLNTTTNTNSSPNLLSATNAIPQPLPPLTEGQRQSIARLSRAFNGIRPGAPLTQTHWAQLRDQLQGAAQGQTRLSDRAIATLANGLMATLAQRGMNPQQRAQLAVHVNRVLNSENLSVDQTQTILRQALALVQKGAPNPQAARTIYGGLVSIASELHPGVEIAPADQTNAAPRTP